MDRWVGKVAVVTGASSGIGAAIAIDLAKAGMIVVGLARRVERVEELKALVPSTATGALHAFKCDVSKESEVKAAFDWVIEQYGGVDVLINNAGIVRLNKKLLDKDNSEDIQAVLDTNVTGVVWCTREAFQSMKSRNVDGHIVIINSIVGHIVPYTVGNISLNIYPPSKHAVTAMTEVLRQELQSEGSKTKITSVSPGGVRTEIIPKEMFELQPDFPVLESEDISAAVLYVLGTPPHVQVHELTIKPVGEKM